MCYSLTVMMHSFPLGFKYIADNFIWGACRTSLAGVSIFWPDVFGSLLSLSSLQTVGCAAQEQVFSLHKRVSKYSFPRHGARLVRSLSLYYTLSIQVHKLLRDSLGLRWLCTGTTPYFLLNDTSHACCHQTVTSLPTTRRLAYGIRSILKWMLVAHRLGHPCIIRK